VFELFNCVFDSTVPLIGESAKRTPDKEFLRMHPKKTLDELVCATDGGVFVVCAEVVCAELVCVTMILVVFLAIVLYLSFFLLSTRLYRSGYL
jgi:hypothetical protein